MAHHSCPAAPLVLVRPLIPVFEALALLSCHKIENNFVAALRKILPRDCRVVILADRGFARVTFLEHVGKLGFEFVVRSSCA